MPRGPVKTWKFSDDTLVPTVLTDHDFLSNGYVWGQDGAVHYCFVDGTRFRFDVWEKEEHLTKFAWLLPNLAAAAVAGWFGGPMAAILTFMAVPTMHLALWGHYRATAEGQPGPVASNGPMMEYPLKGGLTMMAGVSGTFGGIAGFLNAFSAYLAVKAAAAGTITVLGAALGPGTVAFVVGALSGWNGYWIGMYILGKFAHPFDRVIGSGVADPGIGNTNWHFIAQTARSFAAYLIGPKDLPRSAVAGSGGVVGMIMNRAIIYSSPGWPIAVWALIPLAPDGSVIEPPRDPEGGFVYDPETDDPKHWTKGLVLVAGSKTWSAFETECVRKHGAVFAIGTDGYQSPVLGSTGELVMECHPMLDCIQKYGFKMTT